MKLIEQIELANGLTLNIYDLSRQIAQDTAKVEIYITTEIALKESYFAHHDDFTRVKNIFGNKINFEYRKESSFTPIEKETTTRDELIETFKNNSINYIASPNFAQNLALSKLRDIKNNPFKYIVRPEQET
ncbi:MAG TPA: hypothetical protein ENO18_05240 [Caldithrix sp.]|nr:hypothetical protein [Caldithrix sp.]